MIWLSKSNGSARSVWFRGDIAARNPPGLSHLPALFFFNSTPRAVNIGKDQGKKPEVRIKGGWKFG